MTVNKNLQRAKATKNDEFYTRLTDIERELNHYVEHFKGKIIYCNCDDPRQSNFWRYFHMNFTSLGLKKLISTYYEPEGGAYAMEYVGGDDLNVCEGEIHYLIKSTGSFLDDECVKLLMQADIVCTNPPFSLFRQYLAQLIKYNKQFIIIGNTNSITYKEVFPLIKANKVWLGCNYVKEFLQPDGSLKKFGNVKWFTNLDHSKRHKPIELVKCYSPDKYLKYDNYDAIEVGKVLDIPCDYEGVMGVPITFMDKYCLEQFELLGATESEGKGFSNDLWMSDSGVAQPMVNGKRVYKRLFIKRK